MADKWSAVEGDQGWEVQRNGSWFSYADDEQDAIGMARAHRAERITVTETDGYRRTVTLR